MHRTLRTGIAALATLFLPVVATDAQQPVPPECAQSAPVCALKNGSRQTYWNTCLATRDGAELMYAGECRQSRSYG
ncbi:MAG TPA: hypothetical protein VGN21_00560 [Stellaceae bacterium]